MKKFCKSIIVFLLFIELINFEIISTSLFLRPKLTHTVGILVSEIGIVDIAKSIFPVSSSVKFINSLYDIEEIIFSLSLKYRFNLASSILVVACPLPQTKITFFFHIFAKILSMDAPIWTETYPISSSLRIKGSFVNIFLTEVKVIS